jgi:hypothetical protein
MVRICESVARSIPRPPIFFCFTVTSEGINGQQEAVEHAARLAKDCEKALLDKQKATRLKKKSEKKTAKADNPTKKESKSRVENTDSLLRRGQDLSALGSDRYQEAVVSIRKFVARPLAVKWNTRRRWKPMENFKMERRGSLVARGAQHLNPPAPRPEKRRSIRKAIAA